MRHRIFHDGPLAAETTVEIAGDELHHAVRVVRVREGEAVEVFDGRGRAWSGVVASIGRDRAAVTLQRELPSREAPLDLRLAMAVIQLEKFELVLQKATELGVSMLVPLVTERIELRRERYAGKQERWERIVFEAVKQSGRSRIPRLAPPAAFPDVVAEDGTKIVFDADAEPSPRPARLDAVTLLVGPEGGWSEEELALARDRGCLFQRLGPRRLRAETAGIVATAVTIALHGDHI